MKRVIVIIDGSNLYHKLKSFQIHNLINFKYIDLVKKLVGRRKLIKATYYIGSIRSDNRDEKTAQLYNSQLKLFNNLFHQKIDVEKGYLMKNKDGTYHEKGVDVKMAVDLLIGAYENIYDTAIVISSDSDLVPAIKKVREKMKSIEYVGFKNKPSYGLIMNADKTILLTKLQLESLS
jgi:uncharacterized LabA/DUF88 family protein